ncbi:N-acetylmuramoyl-L-alanine amidase [Gottfriedia luciferensis]|uniref:N-acetylmuramoyl-L-alanine amidase n=1 Tax=Gottfriedia luciferensis TaxID=178774 RepID=UPI000B4425CD|nr:N-acetylmuramoyl-L-alanine amidase [Gottfriedia luciferensis]
MYLKLRNYVFKVVMILSLITSSLFFSLIGGTSSKAATTQTGEVTASTLNMRTGPSTAYGKVLTLKKGNKLPILEKKNGWYKTKFNNKSGWASDDYIKIVNTATSTTPKVLLSGEITAASLNVRTSPNTSGKVILALKKGTKVSVVEKNGTWYKINTSKGYGWVSSTYVKQTNSTTTKPPTTSPPSGNTKPPTTNPPSGNTKPPTTTPPSGNTKPPSNSNKSGKVTTSVLNVRTGPAATYQSIKTITNGTVVTIKDEKDGWYQITIGTITGWVSAKYIQQINSEDMDLENFILVIDPGHGGTDPGTSFKTSTGAVYKESMIVLNVSQYLKGFLVKLPIKSYFTRESDVYPTLTQRVNFAKSKNANAYISIHINATASHTGNGTETYYYGESKTSPNNSPTKLQDSMTLADSIQKRLVEKLKLKDRGTKSGNFQVIRESTMASILTELGYVDNPADNVKLSSATWQKEAAKGIYLGILDYLNTQGYNVDSYYIN